MFKAQTEKRVAVFFANGLEECEALVLTDLLFRAGVPCDKVSITDNLAVTSSHEVTVVCDRTIADDDFDFDAYDMLVLPGGIPGTPNLKACAPLMEQVARFHRKGKMIAAICAAPSIFAQLGLLKGVRATCNPSVESILLDGGADLVRENAVTTGNIITSRAMGTAIPFALAIVEHYLGKEKADDLGRNILYYQ